MENLSIDSGHRGSAIYCNYKMQCRNCSAKLASYFLYADSLRRDMMESGEFEKREDHICPKCKERAVRVLRKMTTKESHFRLNAHKDGMNLPSREELNAKVLDDYNAAVDYRNYQDKLEFKLRQEGLNEKLINQFVGDRSELPEKI